MSAGGPEDERTGAPHERCFTTSVLSVAGRSHALNCALLLLWDRPMVDTGLPARSVEIYGEMTGWERVPLVRVDDVTRGTYFHLTLGNLPVGVRLRMKWCINGSDTVDARYEVESDDGFGGRNNVLYVDPKTVRPSQARFPVALPLHGDALRRALRATNGELESARMPEETIETVRLYHSYKHMRDLKDAHPEMGWAEVKDRAALEAKRANRRKDKTTTMKMKKKKKKKKKNRLGGARGTSLSMASMSAPMGSLPSGFSRMHLGMEGSAAASMMSSAEAGSSLLLRSKRRLPLSGAGVSSAALLRKRVGKRGAGNGSGSLLHGGRGGAASGGAASGGTKIKRHPPKQQAGTLSMCQGLSIYELENRIQSVVKTSRSLARGTGGTRRRGRNGGPHRVGGGGRARK
jgi:hypothetical protein